MSVVGIVLAIVLPIVLTTIVIVAVVVVAVRMLKNTTNNAKQVYATSREQMFKTGEARMYAWVEPRSMADIFGSYRPGMGAGILELHDNKLIFTPKSFDKPAWVMPAETLYVGTAPYVVPAIYLYQEQLGHLTIFLSFKKIFRARSKENSDWIVESGLSDDMVHLIFRAGGHPLPEEFQIRRSRYGL